MKKISIIVPCYNAEKTIDRCIRSLVQQTIGVENLEIIIVDDASTDGTRERILRWEKRFQDSVKVITCTENGRQGRARNIGLSSATADYIGYVDADDYVSNEMYQILYEKAEKFQPDVVKGLTVREYSNGEVAFSMDPKENGDQYVEVKTLGDRHQLLSQGLPGYVVSGIYKKSMLIQHQISFPEMLLYEDNYWGSLVCYSMKSYYIVNQILYHYVVNSQSTVMKKDTRHHLDRLKVELMKVEELTRRGYFEEFHEEIEFDFIKLYFVNTMGILFTRFEDIPYDVIYEMQRTVKKIFPNYQKNKTIDLLNPLQKELLKIVEVNLTEENIDMLASEYRKVLKGEAGS